MVDKQTLFNDEDMRHYLVHGYVTLKCTFPATFHRAIYKRIEEVFEEEGNPGNNILPRIPALQRVIDDPAIVGALTSVLGPNYALHSHRHCHRNAAHSTGGGWHRDSYWGYQKVRHHRNRWAMIFYYPQDVSLENGPTGVMRGTQYYETQAAVEAQDSALPVCGEAGTATLVHFDLWHKACPNPSDWNRYMLKFQFTRMEEPMAPSWNIDHEEWQAPTADAAKKHQVISSQLWKWHCRSTGHVDAPANRHRSIGAWIDQLSDSEEGVRLEATNLLGALGEAAKPAIPSLLAALRDEAETVRLNASYALGAVGEPAVNGLIGALDDEMEEARLNAAYGLGMVGAPAAASLIESLNGQSESTRGFSAFALGDMGANAGDEAVEGLARLVCDPSLLVRSNVAEALGTIRRKAETAVPVLIAMLEDEDGQVRYEAAYALARFGPEAEAALSTLVKALEDENRYARNHSAEALRRIGTPEAQSALTEFLLTSRWCPLTSKSSAY